MAKSNPALEDQNNAPDTKTDKDYAKERASEIDSDSRFDAEEKQILKLYDQGVQNYAIAQKVYKFVNQDTVGKVILTIRKAHSDDWNEVEDVNSTKGYSGVQ